MLGRLWAAAHSGLVDLMNLMHRPARRPRVLDPVHRVGQSFHRQVNAMVRPRILEIGARDVTGVTQRQNYPGAGEYVGFDLHPGPGVDVVGDVHRLGDRFHPGSFDAALAISTFEHLLFPWKAVLELNRVMRVGGLLLVVMHPVWPPHELPWDFWRFPKGGFTGLFNAYTGFEIRECEEGLPARLYSLAADLPTRGNYHHLLNQSVAVIAEKTAE